MKRTILIAIGVILAAQFISTQAQPPGFGGPREGRGARSGGRGFGGFRGGFGGGSGERVEPEDLKFEQGVAMIPDRETFEKLSYQGPDVMIDGYLANLEFVKFIIENAGSDEAQVYWMNTENYRAHPHFMREVGIGRGAGLMRGAVTYMPRLKTPEGSPGLYVFDFEPNDSYTFEEVKFARDILVRQMPSLNGKLAFHPLPGNVRRYEQEKDKYAASDVPVHRDEDLYSNIGYLPLNIAESYGRLRILANDARPSPRDIVICKTLPNQMPRVAGVISEVRQTPLSHVNLRAVQDKVPNAFINQALEDKTVQQLMGKLVHYAVTEQGYTLREATKEEVNAHFERIRPSKPQDLVRDLDQKEIMPLTSIQFEDAESFGVKTTNLAVMHTFDFPEGTVPDGFGIPFYYYDQFMKHNRFYDLVDSIINNPQFKGSRDVQERELKKLRSLIKKGMMPGWMLSSLQSTHKAFPAGASVRCRSSTNNEDLPGFSGAGLYDSYTHKTDEGHLSKSIKQVYASLWNFRAFEEREFYRVDHKKVAMGVLLHLNFKGEQANGVAVTDDILYESEGNYYVNTQVGEDLVTNPDAEASPEEVLLAWWKRDGHEVVRKSQDGDQLLDEQQLDELRDRLARIHGRFRRLYKKSEDDQFAMEIEFKITKDGKLAIKQARPWAF